MYSEQTKELLSHLHFGKNNAIKREQLARELGVADREARKRVSYARLEGVCINNDQDGAGYYIPLSRMELERQYRQTLNRAVKILNTLKAQRAELGRDQNQLELEDCYVVGGVQTRLYKEITYNDEVFNNRKPGNKEEQPADRDKPKD